MLKTYRLLLLCFLLLFAVDSLAANLPRCEKELPIFPAAIRDRDLEAELRTSEPDRPIQGWEFAHHKRSSVHLAFTTGMPAEKVLNFYLQMFGVAIREGEPAPPLKALAFHDQESFSDCFDDQGKKISEGEQARIAMEKNRRPFRPEKWLECASFFWVVEENNGGFSELNLQICDTTFACRKESRNGRTETEIRFSRITWQNPKPLIAETEPPEKHEQKHRVIAE
jgi:hypothetical protein